MMENNFVKGAFLVFKDDTYVFAICGGNKIKTKDGIGISLIAYSDPTNYKKKKNKNGSTFYELSPILSVGLDGKESEYVIYEKTVDDWRYATQTEINKIVVYLHEKGFKWLPQSCELKKLTENEKTSFVNDENSLYSESTVAKKNNYKQKKEISVNDDTKRNTVVTACQNYNKFQYKPYHYANAQQSDFQDYWCSDWD